jgi:hypothetical protein
MTENIDNHISYKEYILLKKRIQKELITYLYNNYSVYDKNNICITKNEFEQQLYSTKQCVGLLKNYKQCTKNALSEQNYCSIHIHKYKSKEQEIKNVLDIDNNQEIQLETKEEFVLDKNTLKKKFIEDTFYYIDDKFIYDMSNLDKVGYIKDDFFHLTTDPFLLNYI